MPLKRLSSAFAATTASSASPSRRVKTGPAMASRSLEMPRKSDNVWGATKANSTATGRSREVVAALEFLDRVNAKLPRRQGGRGVAIASQGPKQRIVQPVSSRTRT